MTVPETIDGRPRCDAWTRPAQVRRRWGLSHQCPNPARFRVQAHHRRGGGVPDPDKVPYGPVQPCGRHVRPYLMDNGDSVWQPWLVERLP